MTLMDGLIAMGIVGIIFAVVIGKVMQNNPKFAEMVKGLFSGGIYKEQPPIDPLMRDRIQQTYDEKRSMM